MRLSLACSIVLLTLAAPACKSPQSSQPVWTTQPSGLGVVDLLPGAGAVPRAGQTCVVEATGWVEDRGGKGAVFLDTRKRGFPASFPLGGERVIRGWEEGVATMRKGGRRLLRVPPPLGYTPQEAGHDIPPGATLIFELDLIDIR